MAEPRRAVVAEIMDGIGLITFKMPVHNVATSAEWDALTAQLDAWADDPAVRVVVLTGAGHHAFVTDPEAAAEEDQAIHDAAARNAQAALARFPKPAIARVRGDCIGAGLLLALHADLIVAAEDSAFSLPAARFAAAYAPDAIARLTALVGPAQAKRMLFAGGRIEAREAHRIGLATLLCADADLSDIVVDLAREIADNAPLAVAAAKRAADDPADPANADAPDRCRASADYAHAREARRANRQPAFTGR